MESQEFIVSLNNFLFCGERDGGQDSCIPGWPQTRNEVWWSIIEYFLGDQETTFFALRPANGDIPTYSDTLFSLKTFLYSNNIKDTK